MFILKQPGLQSKVTTSWCLSTAYNWESEQKLSVEVICFIYTYLILCEENKIIVFL